ncbi:hypothetical protein [Novosphingobium sp. ES2-1]|uniref:hypothetical protein n=1 Tax=Novosphingobium sp. ES2-1 TaxID=2780074 RepID=UPI001880D4AD|nr:hypothetical protein [Novosphingobium sp. ES2-1]QOV94381.1 hypothetical protein IM701_02540 [Novosphingobium sp. ES2-1]
MHSRRKVHARHGLADSLAAELAQRRTTCAKSSAGQGIALSDTAIGSAIGRVGQEIAPKFGGTSTAERT